MTIHVLVEGPSERALFEHWKLAKGVPLRVYPHQGKGHLPKSPEQPPDPKKRGLLDQLPSKLRAFAQSLDPDEDGVLVLVDLDDDDPHELTKALQATATAAGLVRSASCLAIEETEAFYLGDLKALKRAFPKADIDLAAKYVPDSIVGTWEYLGRVIGDGGGNKVSWAEAIAPHLTADPKKSRSPSFRTLVARFRELLRAEPKKTAKRRYRHSPRPSAPTGRR